MDTATDTATDTGTDTTAVDGPRQLREHRRHAVETRARSQGDIVSRSQCYVLGMTRAEVKAELTARRWQTIGRHCLAIHNGPLTTEARHWVAVVEAGPRAFIDAESSLVLGGLQHYTVERIRVSVPRGARIRHRGSRLDIRQTRRFEAEDLAPGSSPPRSRDDIAAVRAALWAASDRQAALVLTMTVQQRMTSVDALARQMLRVRRDRRRAFINGVILDLAGGVSSLSELDVLRGCRERGLPEPDVQALRRTRNGVYYLDFRWARWKVVLEVDGIQHTWVVNVVGDALRQNSLVIDGDTVLRIPVLGLRVCPDEFFDQVEHALTANGWVDPRRTVA